MWIKALKIRQFLSTGKHEVRISVLSYLIISKNKYNCQVQLKHLTFIMKVVYNFYDLEVLTMKRTFQPKKRQDQKEHGFRKRMQTRAGQNVLKSRRTKGRKNLSK